MARANRTSVMSWSRSHRATERDPVGSGGGEHVRLSSSRIRWVRMGAGGASVRRSAVKVGALGLEAETECDAPDDALAAEGKTGGGGGGGTSGAACVGGLRSCRSRCGDVRSGERCWFFIPLATAAFARTAFRSSGVRGGSARPPGGSARSTPASVSRLVRGSAVGRPGMGLQTLPGGASSDGQRSGLEPSPSGGRNLTRPSGWAG